MGEGLHVCAVFSAISSAHWCLEDKIRLQSISIHVMCIMFLTLMVLPYSGSGASNDLGKVPAQARMAGMQK